MNALIEPVIELTRTVDTDRDELVLLQQRMRQAFDQQEWQNLAGLDEECRYAVSKLVSSADPEVVSQLTETLRFYAELVTRCEVSKNQLADDAISLRHANANGRVYRSLNVLR